MPELLIRKKDSIHYTKRLSFDDADTLKNLQRTLSGQGLVCELYTTAPKRIHGRNTYRKEADYRPLTHSNDRIKLEQAAAKVDKPSKADKPRVNNTPKISKYAEKRLADAHVQDIVRELSPDERITLAGMLQVDKEELLKL